MASQIAARLEKLEETVQKNQELLQGLLDKIFEQNEQYVLFEFVGVICCLQWREDGHGLSSTRILPWR